jgi:hypothetical protein
MEWIKIDWINTYEDEPYVIFMELTDDRQNTRKIELYKNGKIGYAIGEIEINGVRLNEEKFPTVNEYNILNLEQHPTDDDEVLLASNIGKDEFEDLWFKSIVGVNR